MSDVKPNDTFSGGYAELSEVLNYDGAVFIEKVYALFLKRTPDPVGLKYYLVRLNSGISKKKIIYDLASSKEARALGVNSRQLKLEQLSNDRFFIISLIFRAVIKLKNIFKFKKLLTNSPIISNAEMLLKNALETPEQSKEHNSDFENIIGLFGRLIEQQNQLIQQHGTLISLQDQLVTKILGIPAENELKTVSESNEAAANMQITFEASGLSSRAKLIQAEIHKKTNIKGGT